VIQDSDDATTLKLTEARVQFTNVLLSYFPGSPVLQGINLDFQNGLHAIVGSSGCGKTSVLQLISRHYDPSQGSISIDGVDIRTVTLKSLRNNIATVTKVTA